MLLWISTMHNIRAEYEPYNIVVVIAQSIFICDDSILLRCSIKHFAQDKSKSYHILTTIWPRCDMETVIQQAVYKFHLEIEPTIEQKHQNEAFVKLSPGMSGSVQLDWIVNWIGLELCLRVASVKRTKHYFGCCVADIAQKQNINRFYRHWYISVYQLISIT